MMMKSLPWLAGPAAARFDIERRRMRMTLNRRQALALLAAGIALPPGLAAAAGPGSTLKEAAGRKGLRIGNAMAGGPDRFENPAYRALTARECHAMVCENATKWTTLQPRPGVFDFKAADAMFAWARKEGLKRRGHTLVWQEDRWAPSWLVNYDFGAQPGREAERILSDHITTVTRHFGDDLYSWDVMNEAVDPATSELRDSVLTRRLGGPLAQIDMCFRLARANVPRAQLVYNDYMGPEAGSAKHRVGVLRLLEALKSKGTPIDALGMQSHVGPWSDLEAKGGKAPFREWRKFLDEVTGMGYKLVISEFDVSDRALPGDVSRRDAGVAARAKDYLDVTLSYRQVTDLFMWGMSDNANWLRAQKSMAMREHGMPSRTTAFDDTLAPKPMYDAMIAAFREMPPRA
jgi:endo-1,4-beta-xylanase